MLNHYYKVVFPKKVWLKTGDVPGNSYYGAARIYDVQGAETWLQSGDEIHNLVGGLFAIRGPFTYEVLLKSPDKLNMHFCKDYTSRDYYVNKIVSTECVEIAQSEAHIPARYAA